MNTSGRPRQAALTADAHLARTRFGHLDIDQTQSRSWLPVAVHLPGSHQPVLPALALRDLVAVTI